MALTTLQLQVCATGCVCMCVCWARAHVRICVHMCVDSCVSFYREPSHHTHPVCAQAFNWESCHTNFYQELMQKAPQIKADGFTAIWCPPPSNAVSDQVCRAIRHVLPSVQCEWYSAVI